MDSLKTRHRRDRLKTIKKAQNIWRNNFPKRVSRGKPMPDELRANIEIAKQGTPISWARRLFKKRIAL